jgi:hypothetical protein
MELALNFFLFNIKSEQSLEPLVYLQLTNQFYVVSVLNLNEKI